MPVITTRFLGSVECSAKVLTAPALRAVKPTRNEARAGMIWRSCCCGAPARDLLDEAGLIARGLPVTLDFMVAEYMATPLRMQWADQIRWYTNRSCRHVAQC